MSDIETMQIIRDAFLQGRDVEAIGLLSQLNREFEPKYHNKMLPINSRDGLAPDDFVQIIARTQLPFKAMRFALASRIAESFTILEIRCGVYSQLITPEPIDGDFFASRFDLLENEDLLRSIPTEDGFVKIVVERPVIQRMGVAIDMPWCLPGTEILIYARNHTHTTTPFLGAFFGYARKDGIDTVSQT